MLNKLSILLASILFITSCSPTTETKQQDNKITSVPLSYARKFAIKKSQQFTVLELLGNKNNNEVTATFVLYKNQKPTYGKNA